MQTTDTTQTALQRQLDEATGALVVAVRHQEQLEAQLEGVAGDILAALKETRARRAALDEQVHALAVAVWQEYPPEHRPQYVGDARIEIKDCDTLVYDPAEVVRWLAGRGLTGTLSFMVKKGEALLRALLKTEDVPVRVETGPGAFVPDRAKLAQRYTTEVGLRDLDRIVAENAALLLQLHPQAVIPDSPAEE